MSGKSGMKAIALGGGLPGVTERVSAWAAALVPLLAGAAIVAIASFRGALSAAETALAGATVLAAAGFVGFLSFRSRAAIRRQRREIRVLSADRDRAAEEILRMERLTALGETLVAVAHDINNPLTAVLGFCELAMSAESPEDTRDHLGIVRDQAERCRRLVLALLPFSRKPASDTATDSVNDLIASVLQLREFGFRSEGIRIETDLCGVATPIRCPPAEAQLAVLNLVVNAEHALAGVEGERVLTITTSARNGDIRVEVTDNGPGVDPAHRERIFESFFTTKPSGLGTGLGLVTARRAAERWGGRLWLEAPSAGGARFVISWPSAEMEAEDPDGDDDDLPEVAGLRVVAIDDETFMRRFYRETLAARGCETLTFGTGEEAMVELRRGLPDVVITDCVRPGEVTDLNLDRFFAEIPGMRERMLIVTGEPGSVAGAEGISILPKPFSLGDLLSLIRAIADRPREETRAIPSVNRPGRLEADRSSAPTLA